MEDKKFWRDELRAEARKMRIDPQRKMEALDRVARRTCGREPRYRPGWRELVKLQLLSVPVSAWLLQTFFLLLPVLAEGCLRKRMGISGWEIFPALSVCMALGAAVLVNELSRHFSFRMAELEQSCYLSLSQLWLMRACCVSGLDVLAVTALGIGRAQNYGFGWFAFAVYVLTPFFVTNAALLAFFAPGRRKSGAAVICFIAPALLSGLCTGFWGRWIYEAIWLPVWLFLLALALAVCAAGAKGMGKKMEEEGLCWN